MSPADKTQIEKISDPKNKSKMSPTDNEHIDDESVTNSGNEKVYYTFQILENYSNIN